MTLVVIIETSGIVHSDALDGIVKRVNFARPMFESMAAKTRDFAFEAIATQGASTPSGPWESLKATTVEAKLKHGYPPEALVATYRLLESIHDQHDPEHIERYTEDSVEIGSSNPYLKYHQSKEPRTIIPRRAPLDLTEVQTKLISEHGPKWILHGEI